MMAKLYTSPLALPSGGRFCKRSNSGAVHSRSVARTALLIGFFYFQSHICKVHACSAVTCQLHFWRNNLDLLRATAVTRGWNGYRNKSQHRKSTLEKNIFPLLLPGLEPGTFRPRAGALTTEISPIPVFRKTLLLSTTRLERRCC